MSGDEDKSKMPDADQVKEILDVVADKIPALLNSLADVLYGKQNSLKYGEAVAGFYKSLKASGMTDEQAYELTKQYMSAMNLPGMIGEAIRGGRAGERGKGAFHVEVPHEHDDEDEK